ncbi:carbohydrate kinase [Planococcus sp. CP5-4]|uniref:carbohydrate kinase family protein n=1 Tax=unclassified Planococcus (in: firmicutes) TaxID=2662419 RepID=UPI001C2415E3|nr:MULTISPECIES: carbohydrate kinase [unclassified Planococcus (in: firmicutes)]MBU9673346.1 carbohydrate kinase [Planococcus sp. CP5-4_YE]MBV0908119.1 carbohydrate kinase [Planococcus sp. CP5-4_UN]MBW6062180.1 carbohydrate kinase [Planococcus sp. CP5-4]
MGNLFSIGEVLIDFIPHQKGIALKDVESFTRVPGGAPANVAAAVAKFGGTASMITKVGQDAFGDFLLERLAEAGVRIDKILRTKEANTGLAFVSLREDGERDFSFYRNPSADLLLEASEVNEDWFGQGDVLHFGSVDLVESPMKKAHYNAITAAKRNGAIISFDPNVRLPLWDNPKQCREAIQEFIPKAHIIKVSDDELEFITGIANESLAVASLFTGDVLAVVLTKGAKGADLYVQNEKYPSPGYSVKVEDTTGAGDAFTGAFLYQLLKRDAVPSNLEALFNEHHQELLAFANASGALATTGKGAISSLPTKDEVLELME